MCDARRVTRDGWPVVVTAMHDDPLLAMGGPDRQTRPIYLEGFSLNSLMLMNFPRPSAASNHSSRVSMAG